MFVGILELFSVFIKFTESPGKLGAKKKSLTPKLSMSFMEEWLGDELSKE